MLILDILSGFMGRIIFIVIVSIVIKLEALAENLTLSTHIDGHSEKRKMIPPIQGNDCNTSAIYDKDGNMYHERDYRKSMKGGKVIW